MSRRTPPKREILDRITTAYLAASDMMSRWDDGIAPEIRAEIMTRVMQPLLDVLLETGRLPGPRPPGRRSPT